MAVTAAYRARRASILLMSVYCVANLLLGGWPPLLDVSALHTGLHLFCETLGALTQCCFFRVRLTAHVQSWGQRLIFN
jgi:hypothetical protein